MEENFEKKTPSEDVVNHPKHYMASNDIEAIDVIEGFTDPITWNSGNVIKYILRWKKKNGLEDLKKAQFYMDRLVRIVGETVKEETK